MKVTGSKTGYTTISRVSTGTATLGRGSLTAPVPAISGEAKVGSLTWWPVSGARTP